MVDLPRQCRFNRPTDHIDEEEYSQYIYAMQLWLLQDELGLSFEMACMDRSSLRPFNYMESLLEYRTDIDIKDMEKVRLAEEVLRSEYGEIRDRTLEWGYRHFGRFKPSDFIADVSYLEGHEPEFTYK